MNRFLEKQVFGGMLLQLFLLGSVIGVTHGQVILRVDMDTTITGIQDTRVVSASDVFDVEIFAEVVAGGLDIYGVDVQFDTVEADLTGSPASVESPAPFPLINFTGGVLSETERCTSTSRTWTASCSGQ